MHATPLELRIERTEIRSFVCSIWVSHQNSMLQSFETYGKYVIISIGWTSCKARKLVHYKASSFNAFHMTKALHPEVVYKSRFLELHKFIHLMTCNCIPIIKLNEWVVRCHLQRDQSLWVTYSRLMGRAFIVITMWHTTIATHSDEHLMLLVHLRWLFHWRFDT